MLKKLITLCLLIACLPDLFAQFKYPVARKESFDTTVFNLKLPDDYFWMSRQENEKEVKDLSMEQGRLAQQVLDSIPGMDVLQQEMGELYTAMQDEVWAMTAAGGYIYYYRDIAGEGPTLCRRKAPDAPEEKLLGMVSINGQAYAVRKRLFAYNKPLLALMLTQLGDANPQIRIYDLEKKSFLPDSIGPVMFNDSRGVSMAWSPDDKSLFYTQSPPAADPAEKYYRGNIKQHWLHTSQSMDSAVYGWGLQKNIKLSEAETPYVYSFRHSPYLLARIRSAEGENYAYAVHHSKLNGSRTPWIKLRNYANLGDGFDANGKWLYAVTTGAPRYKIVKIDMSTGGEPTEFLGQQKDVIAGTDGSHNKAIVAGKDVLYVLMRKIGDMKILKIDLKTRQARQLPLAGKNAAGRLQLYNDNDLLYCLTSPVKMDLYQWYEHKANRIHNFFIC